MCALFGRRVPKLLVASPSLLSTQPTCSLPSLITENSEMPDVVTVCNDFISLLVYACLLPLKQDP